MSESSEPPWHAGLDINPPYWNDFRQTIEQLQKRFGSGPELPGLDALQALLKDKTTRSGLPLRLVSSTSIPNINYEQHIFETGEISTRKNCWHDFFNALVWSRFSLIKAAMNELHYREIENHSGSNRGPLRDALTLFDECGVVVLSTNREMLSQLANRDWSRAFIQNGQHWKDQVRVWVCGHALLEKFLKPYKSITAQGLLLHADPASVVLQNPGLNQSMEEMLSGRIAKQGLLRGTADLSPIPLMGIPQWWTSIKQDEAFYQDERVFRPARAGFTPAPVFDFSLSR